MGKRIELKKFRVGLQLTQQEVANRLNVSRATYIAIENGDRNGTLDFWRKLQTEFAIPDAEIWGLQKQDGRRGQNEKNDKLESQK